LSHAPEAGPARGAGSPAAGEGPRGEVAALPAPHPKTSSWSLPLRVVSGVLFVPILILLSHVGRLPFLGFVALQVTLALTEFYRMMRGKGLRPYALLGTLGGLGVLWMSYRPVSAPGDFLATASLLLALAFGLRRPDLPRTVESVAVTLFGVLYVGWLSAHLVLLRELPWRAGTPYAEGRAFVLLAFFVTWSCDTGAYAIGRKFGRTRPWTRISPLKSLEGSVGGFAFALAAAFVARAWFAPFLRVGDAVALGALVGVFAQVGDLVESLLKRDASHGDSSDLIPGHGGVLDRFDSLYFSAPIVYYYLKLVVYQVP
jgi:phosphatidate cytidylyltransferase